MSQDEYYHVGTHKQPIVTGGKQASKSEKTLRVLTGRLNHVLALNAELIDALQDALEYMTSHWDEYPCDEQVKRAQYTIEKAKGFK